ncbi:MAG: hypothetical protein ACWA40_09650 [Planktomarina sp.]
MHKKPNWDALGRLFDKPAPKPPKTKPPPSAAKNGCVMYLGEVMPKWQARDLMQERAAIREFDGGEPRHVAEAETRKGLSKHNPAQ